jgi:hypothetical protein
MAILVMGNNGCMMVYVYPYENGLIIPIPMGVTQIIQVNLVLEPPKQYL